MELISPIVRVRRGVLIVQGPPILSDLAVAVEVACDVLRDQQGGVPLHPRWGQMRDLFRAEAAAALLPMPTSEAGTDGIRAARGSADLSEDEFMTTREAAAEIGVSDRYVLTLRSTGVLRSGQKRGGRWRFDRREVAAEAARRAQAHNIDIEETE